MEKKSNLSLVVLLAIVLTACVMTETNTVRQRYFAVKSSYEQVLISVVGYTKYCTGKTGAIKVTCDKNITKIKELDNAIHLSMRAADLLLETKDASLLASNIDTISSQVSVLGMFMKGIGN